MTDETKKLYKRRKRMAYPKTLIFFGVIFLLMPLFNYVSFAYRYQIPITQPGSVLMRIEIPALILMFAAIAVGIGLLLVKKWGWWLFMIYGTLIIVYNFVVVIRNPGLFNAGALLQAILGCAAVFYFVHKDVSAPFMKMYPRGWRMQKREPHAIDVTIDGIEMKTRDFSPVGFYVDWPDCPHEPDDAIKVAFKLNNQDFNLDAGVVRVDGNGAGIAFRYVDRDAGKLLKKELNAIA